MLTLSSSSVYTIRIIIVLLLFLRYLEWREQAIDCDRNEDG